MKNQVTTQYYLSLSAYLILSPYLGVYIILNRI